MTQVNEQLVRQMVEKVLGHLQAGWSDRPPPVAGENAPPPISGSAAPRPHVQFQYSPVKMQPGRLGQFTDVGQAVAAAASAQRALMRRSLAQRDEICGLIRQIITDRCDELGRMEYEETKIGHLPHKAEKLLMAAKLARGVEGLATECFSGDHGITLEEHAPWGVIGVVTPVTHSLPTLAINAINMIAAGNALVCNPHPNGKRVAALGAKLFNQAIHDRFGIDNLICTITEPTIESANAIFKHPDIRLLCVTGGPGVVAAALASGKRAICAGPGNPPVVVDESADLANAARCILEGASYDNNLFCTAEKEVFVVAEVWDAMMDAMAAVGAWRVTAAQMDELAKLCLEGPSGGGIPHANRKYVGAEPQTIARLLGLNIPPACRLLYGETSAPHPFVQAEQMMPVLPFVRCSGFEEAVELARAAEHGYRHTSVIHSRLVDHMTHMGKEMDTTLYIKNGPSVAGNGAGGEGYGNYTIACTTGEGIATPLAFTRLRRCTMVDNLRII